MNIAPGLGKTKLILAHAINLVGTAPVFILNTNKTLLNRDFQEAITSLTKLKITHDCVVALKVDITFVTTKDFIT